jgi:hypothetical protein
MKKNERRRRSRSHTLVHMRSPEVTHDILSRCGFREVKICVCCANHEKGPCPYAGHEPVGPCPSFVLDETDVKKTEENVLEFITRPFKREERDERLAA